MKERVTVDDDITDTCAQGDSYLLENLPEGLAKFGQWCGLHPSKPHPSG
jgi:hypothetical protein